MPRQDDAPLPSAPGLRRLAIDVLDQAKTRDGAVHGVGNDFYLDVFLGEAQGATFERTQAISEWVERVLREALRG